MALLEHLLRVVAGQAALARKGQLGVISLCFQFGDEVAQRVPAKRVGGPEDMAGAAIYLASRAGDYVLGQTLVVDGGVTHTRGAA
jgi:NAD(P)-dependent dehydrogenase (short-subunit alcohol dehydrogenase family)